MRGGHHPDEGGGVVGGRVAVRPSGPGPCRSCRRPCSRGSAPAVPVAPCSATTPVSIALTSRSTAATSAGASPTSRARPPTRSTRCGWIQTPSFATAAYTDAIWIGVTAMPCPIGTLPIVGRSTGRAAGRSRGSRRGSRSRSSTRSRTSSPSREPRRAELLGDRDGADVRRVREDLRDRVVDRPARLGVVHGALASRSRTGTGTGA